MDMTYSSRSTPACKIWFDDREPAKCGLFFGPPVGETRGGSLAIVRRVAPAGGWVSVAGRLCPLPPRTSKGPD
jgi:hypothetical protein